MTSKLSSKPRRHGSKAFSKSSGSHDNDRRLCGRTCAGARAARHRAKRSSAPACSHCAIVMFWQTMSIPVSPIYAKVGPTVVPMMTAAALGVLGVLLLIDARKADGRPRTRRAVTPDRAALVLGRRRARAQRR